MYFHFSFIFIWVNSIRKLLAKVGKKLAQWLSRRREIHVYIYIYKHTIIIRFRSDQIRKAHLSLFAHLNNLCIERISMYIVYLKFLFLHFLKLSIFILEIQNNKHICGLSQSLFSYLHIYTHLHDILIFHMSSFLCCYGKDDFLTMLLA